MKCISCDQEIKGKGYLYNRFNVCSEEGKCLDELQNEGIEELIYKKERWIERFTNYLQELEEQSSEDNKEEKKLRISETIGVLKEHMEKLKKHPDVRLQYLF
ncbi:hypothetical protein BAQ48_07720 [Bacillus luti]|uniref:hypothetical protein n=1 Tax=Bacillus luti TaxID=2026191 RepID=UPI0008FE74F5|nr:hypothetical protein [Bacillus luti]OJE52717.1 hypothetical protein BAQ48_07720 [Bacillus luti]